MKAIELNLLYKEFEEIQPGDSLIIQSGVSRDVILKHYTKEASAKGILINVNTKYSELLKELENKNIDAQQLFMIDCMGCNEKSANKKCISIKNKKSLIELSITLAMQLNEGDYTFVVIDSLDALQKLVKNEVLMARFLKYLKFKWEKSQVKGYVLYHGTVPVKLTREMNTIQIK